MRTEDLIRALAADHAAPRPDLRVRLVLAALGGAGLSLAVLLAGYGLRPDLGEAVLGWRVAAKFAVALTLAATAAMLVLRLSRPVPQGRGAWLALVAAPVLLALAGAGELATAPAESWARGAIGNAPLACLLSVPLLSAAPLAGIFWALREGAPDAPAQAGAVAGAMAAGIGASIYALHCGDDSPLFLTVWYALAAAAVTLAGRAGGARLLRW